MSTKGFMLLPLFCLIGGLESEASEMSRAEARGTFAELLAISTVSPDVEVTVNGRETRGGLRTEDVSWLAANGEQVPAFVIRPESGSEPMPAVVCLHGSSGNRDAMATETFGRGEWTRYGRERPHTRLLGWARELARHGYLTLAMTQRGLDSRSPDTSARAKVLLLDGRTVMGEIVQEIRQAVTYLQQRPDVDRKRIGMTGMSFGGITTFYTWLVDERVAVAAPICGGVGSLDVFAEIGSRGYHGIYWWIPRILQIGDQGDFAAAMAPRPLMIWAPLDDIGMPKEGVDRFLEVVEPAYAEANQSQNLVVHRPPGEHQFTLEAFDAMKDFFDDHLKSR